MRKIRRFDAFVLFSVICCSPFPLKAQRPTHDVIVLNEGDVSPKLEELYLKFSCFSNDYEVSITNHALKNSTINVIKRNNNIIILNKINSPIENFVSNSRKIYFQNTRCISKNEIEIMLSGLTSLSGESDGKDVLKAFRLKF